MKIRCPHCGTYFVSNAVAQSLRFSDSNQAHSAAYRLHTCLACNEHSVEYTPQKKSEPSQWRIIDPIVAPVLNIPNTVPEPIQQAYQEAHAVKDISPNACAGLARRCLQGLLEDQGYADKDPSKQIDLVLKETDVTRRLPDPIADSVDLVRNYGVFGVHPIKEKTSDAEIAVQAIEADACLEVLAELIDHYYARPLAAAERRAAVDAKLTAAGKQLSRGRSKPGS